MTDAKRHTLRDKIFDEANKRANKFAENNQMAIAFMEIALMLHGDDKEKTAEEISVGLRIMALEDMVIEERAKNHRREHDKE